MPMSAPLCLGWMGFVRVPFLDSFHGENHIQTFEVSQTSKVSACGFHVCISIVSGGVARDMAV